MCAPSGSLSPSHPQELRRAREAQRELMEEKEQREEVVRQREEELQVLRSTVQDEAQSHSGAMEQCQRKMERLREERDEAVRVRSGMGMAMGMGWGRSSHEPRSNLTTLLQWNPSFTPHLLGLAGVFGARWPILLCGCVAGKGFPGG